jgi:hypothetical protein
LGIAACALLVLSVAVDDCPVGRTCAHLAGHLERGERFERVFGPGLSISMEPSEFGWVLVVRDERPDENIARLTGPFHFVPNPRYVEGWHFRNADNTGPNDGSVNAPQEERRFLFSPEVGRSFDYPLTEPEAEEFTRQAGRGLLTIRKLVPGNLVPREKAWIERMDFTIDLEWPSSWADREPHGLLRDNDPLVSLAPIIETSRGVPAARDLRSGCGAFSAPFRRGWPRGACGVWPCPG